MNVTREADYIVARAQVHDARLVTLGPLMFFSTETGDAWVLDSAESLARCLARDGDRLPSGIQEAAQRFSINWDTSYVIDGDLMVFHDNLGRERQVLGYPVAEIRQALARFER